MEDRTQVGSEFARLAVRNFSPIFEPSKSDAESVKCTDLRNPGKQFPILAPFQIVSKLMFKGFNSVSVS